MQPSHMRLMHRARRVEHNLGGHSRGNGRGGLSQPLVANADRFLVVDDVIFAGYGFTDEPDYLYQINRHNGRVLAKQKLRSGPKDMYLNHYGQLHVRTYDSNYVFQVRAPR